MCTAKDLYYINPWYCCSSINTRCEVFEDLIFHSECDTTPVCRSSIPINANSVRSFPETVLNKDNITVPFMKPSRKTLVKNWILYCSNQCKNLFDKLVDLIIIIPNRDTISKKFIMLCTTICKLQCMYHQVLPVVFLRPCKSTTDKLFA